jgi:hypothetical protein
MPQYYQARQFPNEPTSNTAYEGVRQALYETLCDLSTYRTILLPDQSWHVLVLGGAPDEALRRRIDQSLAKGSRTGIQRGLRWRTSKAIHPCDTAVITR